MAKQSVSIEIDGQRYGEMDQIPRKVPEGRVLAHNHARHTADMGCAGTVLDGGLGRRSKCHRTLHLAHAATLAYRMLHLKNMLTATSARRGR